MKLQGGLWSSAWTRWVGFRYLKSKKNSRFLSFITLISILGVGIGVTAMIVVLSVMDGFEAELKKRLMSSDVHILVTPRRDIKGFEAGQVPENGEEVKKLVSALSTQDGISSFWPILSTEAIFKTGRKVTGVTLKGLNQERLNQLKSHLVESAEPQMLMDKEGGTLVQMPGVYVGQELAFEMGLLPGDPVTLVSPTETEGPMSSVPRLKRFVVEGVYRSGLPEQELHTLFASDLAVRSFLRKVDVITHWEVSTKRFEEAKSVALSLREKAPHFKIQHWEELNSHLFSALQLERIAMFVVLAFIIVVASFNIVTTLTLMVLEKRKEISILKAMGARNQEVGAIFLAEGLFIGTLGIGGGVALGFLMCAILRRYEFITLPDVFYDRTLPVTFDLSYYLIVSLCAFLIVIGACLYPSKRAAQQNPLSGIRSG